MCQAIMTKVFLIILCLILVQFLKGSAVAEDSDEVSKGFLTELSKSTMKVILSLCLCFLSFVPRLDNKRKSAARMHTQ